MSCMCTVERRLGYRVTENYYVNVINAMVVKARWLSQRECAPLHVTLEINTGSTATTFITF